jgi:hypothetical protein
MHHKMEDKLKIVLIKCATRYFEDSNQKILFTSEESVVTNRYHNHSRSLFRPFLSCFDTWWLPF